MRLLDLRWAGGAAARRAVPAGVLSLLVALVGFLCLSARTAIPARTTFGDAGRVDHAALDKQLTDAVRDGDPLQVQALLEQGANANARDDAGDTALMRGALDA